MERSGVGALERRRQGRVSVVVPVLCGKADAPARGRALPCKGWSRDLSAEGVYAMLREGNSFTAGEIVAVDVEVPWESRRGFPFSRLIGTARVVRIDALPAVANNPVWGVALSFCPDVTKLGAITRA